MGSTLPPKELLTHFEKLPDKNQGGEKIIMVQEENWVLNRVNEAMVDHLSPLKVAVEFIENRREKTAYLIKKQLSHENSSMYLRKPIFVFVRDRSEGKDLRGYLKDNLADCKKIALLGD